MKPSTTRTIGVLAALGFTLLLTACGDDGGGEPAAAPATTTTTEAGVFDPDAARDGDDGDAESDGEVFDPDGGSDEPDDDTGSSGSGTPFETSADQEEFCATAEEYVALVTDDPFADVAATARTLDDGNDLLEGLDLALEDGPENEVIYAVEDPLLDLFEVGDDNGNDPAVVTADPAYDEWLEVQDEQLAPILDELCGISF